MSEGHNKVIISIWGMPGAGKTYWGKKISSELNIPFLDLDLFIEETEFSSIKEIFRVRGEKGFRKVETECLRSILTSSDQLILALGGGTPCIEENLDLLLNKTHSIWLNTSLKSLKKNLEKDIHNRPLLNPKEDVELQLKNLLTKRIEYYKRADRYTDEPFDLESILNLVPDSFKN